jgi:hypothetical protein
MITALRMLLFTLLAIFEPLVNFVLGGLTVALFGTALFWSGLLHRPGCPTAHAIAGGLAAAAALALYYGLMVITRP